MIAEEVSISVGEAEAVSDYTNNIREFDEANNEKYGRDEVADALRQ